MLKTKKLVVIFLSLALFCSIIMYSATISVDAATIVTGNNTRDTAYNLGTWQSANYSAPTAVIQENQTESWFKFTIAAGEHIYIRSTYSNEYEGMWIELRNAYNAGVGIPQISPDNVYDADSLTPSLNIDCDNNTSSTQTFYMVVHRGDLNPASNLIYFSLSFYNRIRTGSGTFSFSGTATNPGNKSLSTSGVDSSELRLDLTNSTLIPDNAIVTSITTSAVQSPSQGNVHHKLMPQNENIWYTSIVSSATSGSYNISLSNDIAAKQIWRFKYNAMATAASTMSSVKLRINWQYDMHDTNYKIFIV